MHHEEKAKIFHRDRLHNVILEQETIAASQVFSDFGKPIIAIHALNNESENTPTMSTPVFTA